MLQYKFKKPMCGCLIFFLFTRDREIIDNITKYPLYTWLHNCGEQRSLCPGYVASVVTREYELRGSASA